jgi:hypothetical protein
MEKGNNANFRIIGNDGKNFNEEMNLLHKEGKDYRYLKEKYNAIQDSFIIDSRDISRMKFSSNGMTNMREYVVPI